MALRLGLLAVLLGLMVSGCAANGPRNTSGQVTASATTDAYSIRVGDCIGALPSESTERLTLIPCNQEHHWEAFATSNLTGTNYPGATAIAEQARRECGRVAKGFLGSSVERTKFEVTSLTPTKASWEQAQDREVMCLVGSSERTITGTLAGAGKSR